MSDHDGVPGIAIVGMAGRFPGAPDVETLWRNLCAGVESVQPLDEATLRSVGIGPGEPGFVNAAASMDRIEEFDAAFFGLTRREAELTDPQHRALLETVWAALEHAGYVPGHDDAGRIGLFGGVAENYYHRYHLLARPDLLDRYGFYPVRLASGREYAIMKTAFKLGLSGPAVAVMTACSTSAVATHLAVQSLLAGDCDVALAGGAHLFLPGRYGYTYQDDSILSPDGHVRAFDADARGTVMGSGVAVIALKRLADAVADADTIYAVVRGSAVNNDGANKAGFTAPSLDGQRAVIEDALAVADADAASVGMLEAHGTGTSLGDPIEVAAVTEAYRRYTDRRGYCAIGTLKSNIGHLDVAAGAAGIIKAALSLYHERIPPSINFRSPNPQIDFEASPFYVNTELLAWPRSDQPRMAGVSSFGFGGTNAHVVLEEPPLPRSMPALPSDRPYVLAVSAKSSEALGDRQALLADFLESEPALDLADASHTLAMGRARMSHRSVVVAADTAAAAALLRQPQPQATATRTSTVTGAEVAFLLTGQGAQYLGMGQGLYGVEPVFTAALDECAAIMRDRGGLELTELLFGGHGDPDEAERRILQTEFGQPVIFSLQYALARLWESWGIRPSALIGHSVGEIAAACLGGALSLEAALSLAVARGRLMGDLPRGAMTAVLAEEEVILPLLDETVSLAAVNAPEQCVAAGPPESIEALEQRLAASDVAFRRLPTDRAFHSPMMDPVIGPLREQVARLQRGVMSMPMVSTLTGTWVEPDELAEPEYWGRHARHTVRFMDALGVLLAERPDLVLIEVGPGETLASLARQHASVTPQSAIISTLSQRKSDTNDAVQVRRALGAAWTAGVDVDWSAVNGGSRRRIALPTYPFARERHWVEWSGRPALVAPRDGASAEPMPPTAPPAPGPRDHQGSPGPNGNVSDGPVFADRRERIAAQVTSILSDLSGLDADALDPAASFTELGFDSLFLTQANSQLRRVFGLRFTLGQLLGDTPTTDALAGHIDAMLPPEADAAPTQDSTREGEAPVAQHSESGNEPGLDGAAAVTRMPMTDAQRDVWIVCQLGGDASAAFNLSATLELKGDLDLDAMREAVRQLVRRHQALRATIDATGDHIVLHDSLDIELPLLDLSDREEAERGRQVATFLDSELTQPYDLEGGPLFRPTLIRLGPTDHTLVLSAHHLVSDGWSLGVMQRDLGALYTAQVRGEPANLDEATDFSDFVTWRVGQSQAAEPYWRALFEDPPPQLDLPTDRVRPPVRSFDYGTQRATIGSDLRSAVQGLASAHGTTSFVVLLAAWEILLHRLSGQDRFASGVFVSGQASMGARSLVGLCTNLLALPARLDPGERLADLLTRLQKGAFDAFDNQHYALGNLAAALQLPRDASRPTMVSTVITLETPTKGIEYEDLEAVESVHGRRRFGSFDFEAYLTETADDLLVDFKYSTALFDADTIERWLGHFTQLLREMTASGDVPVSRLRLLDDAQRRDLTVRWNDTEATLPAAVTHERFQHQAALRSEHVAVQTSRETLTYGELNRRANRLARHLRALGVGQDQLVGVHLERTADMVMALLAVHKAGGAYVPLDPTFPTERLAMIAEDAGLHALVTDEALLGQLDAASASVVALGRDDSLIERHDGSDLATPVQAMSLAYVIYTSGSTGRPKGVEVTHVALANLLEAMRVEPGLSPDDVLLAVTTMSFDIAGLELFLPLIVGATVVLADGEEAMDALWLRRRLEAGDVTVMQATPATWQLLLDVGWTGTPGLKALCGGEALSSELARSLVTRVESLWNMYGPTETTIWSSVDSVPGDGAPVSIGHPIANTQLYVLDPSLEPQPLGVPGELYIGGLGLARGYRNRPDLTAERFVTHQLGDGAARRLYRTGDVVRRRADGSLEYIGRSDFQVKIRGFRIELGEIETVLARHPHVKECAVVARGDRDGSKRLVAYIVTTSDDTVNVSSLRDFVRETLPEYMVPAVFVVLDAFPLTANKKVDRARLPEPHGERPDLATEHVPPASPTEVAMARIWEEQLGVTHIGINDNFFDLGGDSLMALRMIMQANRAGMNLTPVSIFRSQTIAELARAADASAGRGAGMETAIGPTPLTPAQLRFLNERETPDVHHWNVSSIVAADRLSAPALRSAVEGVVSHHDALRLRIRREGGEWRQEIVAPSGEVPFESHDLSRSSPEEQAARIEQVCAELQGSFDLAQGPVLRVAHFDCGPDAPDRLFVTIHHFAVDGLTWRVFWEDLEQAYRQAAGGADVNLPPRTTSFREWAMQLEHLARSPRVLDTAEAWLRLPWSEVAVLPTDLPPDRSRNTNESVAVVDVVLSAEDTRRLLRSGTRPEHLILTAVASCLSSWTASPTVLIDILGHGRDATFEEVNLSRTVGFTLSYNPVVLTHPAWSATRGVLDDVTAQLAASPEGFTFELLRFLAPDPALRARLAGLPRADVLFNYAGEDDDTRINGLWRKALERTGSEESPRGLRQYPIAVRARLQPNLRLTVIYSTELHETRTIEARAAEIGAGIRRLLQEQTAAPRREGSRVA